MTLGDLVLVNAFMIQLYMPLEFSRRDLSRDQAEPDRHGAPVLAAGAAPRSGRCAGRAAAARPRRAKCSFDTSTSATSADRADPVRRRFHHPGRHNDGGGRAQRLRQVDPVAAAVPLLRRRRAARITHRRPGHARRHARTSLRARDRHRAAGHRAVQRHDLLQHRLRPARRQPATKIDRRRARRAHPRLHRKPAGRLRHAWSASAA